MNTRALTQAVVFSCFLFCLGATGGEAAEENGRVEIAGDYRYAARESEAVADATVLACREAWRLAVVNSPLYQEQTAGVVDSPLLHDLANTLAENYVQDQQIIEQPQRGRTVGCRVHGFLRAEESVRIIRAKLSGSSAEEQNRTLRIVNITEERGVLLIQFQALKRIDWLNTAYQGTLRESADIMVDFYDEQGMLMRTDRYAARHSGTGQDVLTPGMFGLLKVPKPPAAKSYRVWLVK
jgi:hypothetical protein